MRYDVIVVGAGPAGSTTARECAARGLSTLLLDRAAFPRDKPCGGGVTVRAARLLPFDLTPVTERMIAGMRFSLRGAGAFTRRAGEPLTYLTRRRQLDLYLLEHALAAGVALRQRAPIEAVERGASRVVVHAGGEGFEGRALVAADGANGRTARLAGLEARRWMTVALEGNITPPDGVPAEWADVRGMGGCAGLRPRRSARGLRLDLPQGGSPQRRGLGLDPRRPAPARQPGAGDPPLRLRSLRSGRGARLSPARAPAGFPPRGGQPAAGRRRRGVARSVYGRGHPRRGLERARRGRPPGRLPRRRDAGSAGLRAPGPARARAGPGARSPADP
ncbi:MAG: FAD-dependent oxidoreductase, partial [Chloroflexota bacterium]|nr:FAD-dependent oxidoreductase [Chloroflexota bacterium]